MAVYRDHNVASTSRATAEALGTGNLRRDLQLDT